MESSLWLFLFMGIAGSAAPAHFGFRLLAHRHHLDRGYPFPSGTEEGSWAYSSWLMQAGYKPLNDSAMNFFGTSANIMGWLSLIGVAGTIILIALQS